MATVVGTALIVGVAITVWALLAESGWGVVTVINLFAVTFVVAALFSGACFLVAGVPLTWLLSKMRVENWLLYAICGAVTGALFLPLILFADAPVPLRLFIDQLFETMIGGIAGFIGGTIWWFAARRRYATVTLDWQP